MKEFEDNNLKILSFSKRQSELQGQFQVVEELIRNEEEVKTKNNTMEEVQPVMPTPEETPVVPSEPAQPTNGTEENGQLEESQPSEADEPKVPESTEGQGSSSEAQGS